MQAGGSVSLGTEGRKNIHILTQYNTIRRYYAYWRRIFAPFGMWISSILITAAQCGNAHTTVHSTMFVFARAHTKAKTKTFPIE